MIYAVSPDMATNSALPLVETSSAVVLDTAGDSVVIGGRVKKLVWGGERLVVLFESSNYVLLVHTLTLCDLKLANGGIIKGPDDTIAVTASFHASKSHLLSIVWSDNSIQHVPLAYTSRQTVSNPSLVASMNHMSP